MEKQFKCPECGEITVQKQLTRGRPKKVACGACGFKNLVPFVIGIDFAKEVAVQ